MMIQVDISNPHMVNNHIDGLKKILAEAMLTNEHRGYLIESINHFLVVRDQIDLRSQPMGEA